MTYKEMAIEYRKSLKQRLIDEDDFERLDMFDENVEEAFIAGLKAGRPEWHKVADGDLPKDENRVWIYFGVDEYNDGQFIRGRFWCDSCGWFDIEEVVAWCEMSEYTEE